MTLPHIQRIDGQADMQKLAADVLTKMKKGSLVLLSGDLGAGKTTFTQGLARALGIQDEISSPTFTIISEYKVSGHPVFTKLVHVDLYRLEEGAAPADAMIQEIIRQSDPGVLTVVEWADRLGDLPLPHAWRLKFSHAEKSDERTVEIATPEDDSKGYGKKG